MTSSATNNPGSATNVNAMLQPMAGPSPVVEVVKDMLRRATIVAPIGIMIGAVLAGANGAYSVLYGLGIVMVNFALSAGIISWTSKISLAMLQGGALFGFLVRLGLVAIAVLAVANQSWVSVLTLGLTIIISHLGLLFWELRYISASLAYPGLKPGVASSKETVLS